MTFDVAFRAAARHELGAAAVWYEERRDGLGAAFFADVDRAIAMAAEDPRRFPIMHRRIRCVRVRRFP